MKLEKSTTFDPPRVAWRVTCNGRLSWGPFCFSRTDAIWQWIKNQFLDLIWWVKTRGRMK